MSMEIDISTPLTAAERQYLLERGRDGEVARLDEIHAAAGLTADEVVDYTTWKKADLEAEVKRREALDRVFELPASPTKQQLVDALVEDDADGDEDDE